MNPFESLFPGLFGNSSGHDKFDTPEYHQAEAREDFEEYVEAEEKDNNFADSEYTDGDYDGDEFSL